MEDNHFSTLWWPSPHNYMDQPWAPMRPPILNLPPTSLLTPSLWVVPEHRLWVPCFMHQTRTWKGVFKFPFIIHFILLLRCVWKGVICREQQKGQKYLNIHRKDVVKVWTKEKGLLQGCEVEGTHSIHNHGSTKNGFHSHWSMGPQGLWQALRLTVTELSTLDFYCVPALGWILHRC